MNTRTASPAVAAAVSVNREIITHGSDGLLATTRDEWLAHLGRLLTDPAARCAMGAAGRKTIEARYSLRVTAPQLAGVLNAALQPKR